MKKLLAILPVLLFLLLIAMPAAAGGQGEKEVKEVEKIEITYWQYFYETKKETIDQLIRLFEEANPNISVSHQTFPYENYNTKVPHPFLPAWGPMWSTSTMDGCRSI